MKNTLRTFGPAVLFVAGAFLLGAQSVPAGASPAAGPAVSSIVNIDSFAFPSSVGSGWVAVSTASPLIVYQVPRDRWLILTDVEIGGGGFDAELIEIAGTTVTTKRGSFFNIKGGSLPDTGNYHSRVGLVFAPGSQVAIRNSGMFDLNAAFTLTGYLTRG